MSASDVPKHKKPKKSPEPTDERETSKEGMLPEKEYSNTKLNNHNAKPPPSKSSQDKLYQFYINNTLLNDKEFHFKDNKVDTTKYNFITFLPKALLFQFMRPANVYFLICAIIQCIPIISPLGASTAVVPLIIVLSVSLIREGIEDYQRSKLDKEQNSEPTEVYRDAKWERVQSGELKMGEIVLVTQDNAFPADLVLIDSELPEGVCFIETGTLDGEKTLKIKSAPSHTAGMFNIKGKKCEIFTFHGNCICDAPNAELYQLNGKMLVDFAIKQTNINNNAVSIPLDAKQLLLKGAKLRNTQWVIGVVIYTGHNCKIMKNAKEPRMKYSSVETLMNRALIYIFILQCILCIICAILRGVYYTKNLEKNVLLNHTSYSYALEGFLNFFTYLLLLNTMIPISLIITLEVVKLIQGWLMGMDVNGYSHLRQRFIKPNSVSLNEELGIVDYIFSDKTGTLTCNKMMFKYCVIGDVCYQYIRDNVNADQDDKDKQFRERENIIPFHSYEMYNNVVANSSISSTVYPGFILVNTDNNNNNSSVTFSLENSSLLINEYWTALALCHDCTVQLNDNGNYDYIAMSPDSIELVRTASLQGYTLIESGTSSIKRIQLGNTTNANTNANTTYKDYERLCLIDFTSDRKRETVIIKDKEKDIIKLYIKGADSIIEERLHRKSRPEFLAQCRSYVNKFSAQGYRTLFIGMKVLSQYEYDTFTEQLRNANLDIEHKETKLNEAYAYIERDIYLIGATIVEDKLQDKVPETIRDLRLAGIKIWMLTGDKMNTAYNIGLSCNLISKNIKTFHIEGIEVKKNAQMECINKTERDNVIISFAKEYNKYKGEYPSLVKPQFAILVDEKALLTINEDDDIQKIFLAIAKDAVAVICCRVSPLQKSQVVKMMKSFEPTAITLAIGDGGNDVSMIMEAHIGIGIYGEEGMRAVQSGDYAIGEFKILHELLLFHGRVNYIRNSEVVLYFFYKNFVFTLIQFCYGFYNNFSGQTIIDDWYISLFNLLFTSLPLGVRACMDFDIKPTDGNVVVKMLPFLYNETRTYPIFTLINFCFALLKGVIHCLINYFYVAYTLTWHIVDGNGNISDIWFTSVNLFTNIILIVSVDLIVFTKYHTWMNLIIMGICTFIAYAVFIVIVEYSLMFHSVGTMGTAFGSVVMWLNIIYVVGLCFIIDVVVLTAETILFPSVAKVLQRVVKERGSCEEEVDLPSKIKKKLKMYSEYSSCGGNERNANVKKNLNINVNNVNKKNVITNYIKSIDDPRYDVDENITVRAHQVKNNILRGSKNNDYTNGEGDNVNYNNNNNIVE